MKITFGTTIQLTNKDKKDILDFFNDLSKIYPKRHDKNVIISIYDEIKWMSFYLSSKDLIKIETNKNNIMFYLHNGSSRITISDLESIHLSQKNNEIIFEYKYGISISITSKEIYDSFLTYFKDNIVK